MPDVRGYGVEESNPHFTPGSWRNGGGGGGVGGAVLDVGVGGNMERQRGNHVPNVMYSSGSGGGGKSTLQMPEQPILRRLSDYGGSVDSMDTGEDDSDRRGSVTGSSVGKDGKEGGGQRGGGVGSRLSDLMEKGKGRKKDKRKKDKQGMDSLKPL